MWWWMFWGFKMGMHGDSEHEADGPTLVSIRAGKGSALGRLSLRLGHYPFTYADVQTPAAVAPCQITGAT